MELSKIGEILASMESALNKPVEVVPEAEVGESGGGDGCFRQAFLDLIKSMPEKDIGEPDKIKGLILDLLPACET